MNQPALFNLMTPPKVLADLPPDITLSRHRGSAESIAANPSLTAKRESYNRILDILSTGQYTSKEIAQQMGVGVNVISGRLTELMVLKRIEKTGERRLRAAVLRLKI